MANRYRFDESRHIHQILKDGKWQNLIGTTTALSILAKPLTYWASGLACETMGWKHPKKAKQDERLKSVAEFLQTIKEPAQYLQKLDEAYKAHAKTLDKAADKGTDRHALVEAFIRDGKESDEIKDFILWAKGNVKEFCFAEGHCYSETHYIGGIVDFGFIDNYSRFALADIKSSKEAYLSHFLQTAGYDIQISENTGIFDANGNKTWQLKQYPDYHLIFCLGSGKYFINKEIGRLKKAFLYLLNFYKEQLWWEQVKCVITT